MQVTVVMSGYLVANLDLSYSIIGVAPSSKLLAFKVFGNSGYSDEETVIEGFLKAYESGVSGKDIFLSPWFTFITLSLETKNRSF